VGQSLGGHRVRLYPNVEVTEGRGPGESEESLCKPCE